MSKVAVQGNASGTGTLTIAAPNTNTDRTLTLPDETGTVLTTATPGVPVNGPAFSASMSGSQSISAATTTKIAFNTETFDTNGCYDPTTNYRFTPTVAGYYAVNVNISLRTTGGGGVGMYGYIYKNGSFIHSQISDSIGSGYDSAITLSTLVYLNGSTDYVEAYARVSSGTGTVCANIATGSSFNAAMVRSAV